MCVGMHICMYVCGCVQKFSSNISLHCLMWCHQLFYHSVSLSSIILPLFPILSTAACYLHLTHSYTPQAVLLVVVVDMLSTLLDVVGLRQSVS